MGVIYPLLLQGSVYSLFVLGILFSAVAFGFTLWHGFLYIGASFVASAAIYLGYCRGRIRKQFNIRVSIIDYFDYVYVLSFFNLVFEISLYGIRNFFLNLSIVMC